MALRLTFLFLASVLVFHLLTYETTHATVVRRDTQDKNASVVIEEALQSFKSGVDDFLKNVQENQLFQNISQGLKQFGETVKKQGQDLVERVKSSGGNNQ